jgi:hypothetical protein
LLGTAWDEQNEKGPVNRAFDVFIETLWDPLGR